MDAQNEQASKSSGCAQPEVPPRKRASVEVSFHYTREGWGQNAHTYAHSLFSSGAFLKCYKISYYIYSSSINENYCSIQILITAEWTDLGFYNCN